MTDPNVLLQMMLVLQSKAEAYRAAFPVGSVIDPQSPVYINMLQGLKATNAQLKKMDAALTDEARGLLVTLSRQQQEGEEQAARHAALEAAQQKDAAAAIKSSLDKIGEPGLPTLPFEEAYSPKPSRLQDLISRFSQIGNATMMPRPQR